MNNSRPAIPEPDNAGGGKYCRIFNPPSPGKKVDFVMKAGQAVVFVNGELENIEAVRSLVQADDYLVAVDGGTRHLRQLDLLPDLLVGDLDSITDDNLRELQSAGVEICRHEPEKDETDLELALRQVVERGYRQVVIVAATGGRLDQTLGNLALLAFPILIGCDVRLDDGCEEIFLIEQQHTIYGKAGDIVSLLPFAGDAVGVTTQALQYPLRQETLWHYRTRGISNVMLSQEAVVSLTEGRLLCIHTRLKKAG